ncbi:hypothetical protein ONZ45_g3541 [Pleurotus djamor]|nr:hypothetical protein ONZ45_g3541 [Pleurotus djamor]
MVSTEPHSSATQLDVLIVGGGFSGIYQLHALGKRGYQARIVEAGSGLGGTWRLNQYPGARVDSDVPIYTIGIEELWKEWNWTERFPGWQELQAYFDWVEEKLDINQDVDYNTRVVEAQFDEQTNRWVVKTDKDIVYHARFLSLCTGFASKSYTPDIPGLGSYAGTLVHTNQWPDSGIDVRGKRVGIIGTGASGVQVIQEIAPLVKHLTIFQRTPNLALPMTQRSLTVEMQEKEKKEGLYPFILNRRPQTFGGFHFTPSDKNTFDVTPEERRLFFEQQWAEGGFRFWLAGYADLFLNDEANDEAYAFWRDKVRARINDSHLQEKLAPWKKPHPFGCKRPCLEQVSQDVILMEGVHRLTGIQQFYEVFNQPNITLIDVNENGIAEITPRGVLTQDRLEKEFDILILATGFDSVTGGITQINIKGTDGTSIADKWKDHLQTYLGMTTANFPNMFWVYGPHGPTAFCNGPTCGVSFVIVVLNERTLTGSQRRCKAIGS